MGLHRSVIPWLTDRFLVPFTLCDERWWRLQGKYQDPRTGLRYANAQEYSRIQSLPPSTVEAYLTIRKANVVLK